MIFGIIGSVVLVLGVAYKQDIDDYRESPAIRVIEHLKERGADVSFYDPFITEYREHGVTEKGLTELTPEIVKAADLVMVTTAHTTVDYQMVADNAQLIFDTKNAMKAIQNRDNLMVL